MEVIKCNTEVAMETIGEARNLKAKKKMAESPRLFRRTKKLLTN